MWKPKVDSRGVDTMLRVQRMRGLLWALSDRCGTLLQNQRRKTQYLNKGSTLVVSMTQYYFDWYKLTLGKCIDLLNKVAVRDEAASNVVAARTPSK